MRLFCIVAGISTSLVFGTEHIISQCYGSTCHRQMLKIVRQEDHEFKINLRSTLIEQMRRHRHISYYRNAPTFFSLSTDEMVNMDVSRFGLRSSISLHPTATEGCLVWLVDFVLV